MKTFPGGARRGTDLAARYDLLPLAALRSVAETYAEGAEKHGAWNWERGMPASTLVAHAVERVLAWANGDRAEPHLPHAVWNLLALMHFERTRPDLVDTRRPDQPPGGGREAGPLWEGPARGAEQPAKPTQEPPGPGE